MTDESALLAAVWDRPHDDLPRLVYADWLDETGDPVRAAHAQFIRVQCELAGADEDDPRRRKLLHRERELWQRNAGKFRAGLQGRLRSEPFRRGFVCPALRTVTLDYVLRLPTDHFDQPPLWDFNVEVKGLEETLRLAASPQLLRLASIGLWTMTSRQVAAIADSPNARNLTAVRCRHSLVDRNGLRSLSDSPHLSHLCSLSLDTIHPDAAVAALAASSLADRLTHLSLSSAVDPPSTPAVVEAYSACSRLLDFEADGGARGDDVPVRLARVDRPAGLRRLSLNHSWVTDRGCAAIAGWRGARDLRVLSLQGNRITRDGIAALAASPHLPRLKQVAVTVHGHCSAADLDAFQERFGPGVTAA